MRRTRRFAALILAAGMLLSLAACGSKTAATTMHLVKTQGTVGVADDKGKDIEPREALGLYSGYQVDTQSESYAWIDLDQVKLTKMDQDSEIAIKKEDKHLEIEVKSGSLFFNVTQPLAEDETLEIRSSSMIVGIRGTCGWVEVPDEEHMNVYLLEGKVECSAGGESAAVSAGEMGAMSKSEQISVVPFSASQVPAFVRDEAEEHRSLFEQLPEEDETDFPVDDSTVVLTMPVTDQDVKAAFAQDNIDKVLLKRGPGDDLQFLVVYIDLEAAGKTLMSDNVGIILMPGSSAGNLILHSDGTSGHYEISYETNLGSTYIEAKCAGIWLDHAAAETIETDGGGVQLVESTAGNLIVNNGGYWIQASTTGTISGNGSGSIIDENGIPMTQ